MKENYISNNIVAIGIAEVATYALATDSISLNQNQKVSVRDALSGSIANISRQVKKITGHVCPIFLMSDDSAGAMVSQQAKAEFKGKEICLPKLTQTHRSIIQGNSKVTSSTSLKEETTPEEVIQLIKEASGTIVGPMSAGFYELVVRVLDASSNSYLMLSEDQLQDPGLCLDIGKLATLVVCTEQQLAQLTGCSETVKGIQWVRERDIENILVLCSTEAIGFIDGNWVHVAGYVPLEEKREFSTADLLDCFVGTLAAVRSKNNTLVESIRLAMAAIAIKSEGAPMTDLHQLRQESHQRKPMPLQIPQRPSRNRSLVLQSAALVSSLLAGVTLGTFLV